MSVLQRLREIEQKEERELAKIWEKH
jgi:hypothetical protein